MVVSPNSTDERPRLRSKLRPTVEGFFWLLGAIVLLSQGWLRGVNLVALTACLLIALWSINVLWVVLRFRVKRLELRRRIAEPVFARQPFTVTLEVHNPLFWGQPGLRITDRDSHHQHVWFLPRLRGGGRRQSRYEVTLPRRGRYRWPALVLTTGYPFGLARRTVEHDWQDETIVLPVLGRLHLGRLRRLLRDRPQPTASTRRPARRQPGAQAEFYGLREFRSGDSPRWIHWRTTARVGELMVREFEEPPSENLVLILDAWLPQPPEELQEKLDRLEGLRVTRRTRAKGQEEELRSLENTYRRPLDSLELAVSLAATVCWEWCRNPGAKLALATVGRHADLQVAETGMKQVGPFLQRLAVVQGHPQQNVPRLVDLLVKARLPPGPVLLVSTRASELEPLLAEHLRRSVTLLDVSSPGVSDLFDPTPRADSGFLIAEAHANR